MSSPFNLAQFVDGTNLAIQNIFKKDAKIDLVYPKYYNTRTTEDLIEQDSSLTGLAVAEFTSENAQFLEDTPIQGFNQSYTQQQVDTLVAVTKQEYRFGLKRRNLENIAEEIRRALNRKKEQLAAERLTNGFSTSYTHTGSGTNTTITITGGDGLEPWSTAHTREDGGTAMNNVVYDGTTFSIPFDYAGYKAAARTMSLFVDGRGNPMVATPNVLVCKTGSSVHHKAMEILGALKSGKIAESNDNDGNALPVFKIIHTPYLTKDAAWGMFDSSLALTDKQGFQHIESEPNNIDPVNVVYKTGELQFAGHTMFRQGHNDVARSWCWSEGDSTTT